MHIRAICGSFRRRVWHPAIPTPPSEVLPQNSQNSRKLLAEDFLPRISQNSRKLLAEDILPQNSQNSRKLLAEDILPQISQMLTDF